MVKDCLRQPEICGHQEKLSEAKRIFSSSSTAGLDFQEKLRECRLLRSSSSRLFQRSISCHAHLPNIESFMVCSQYTWQFESPISTAGTFCVFKNCMNKCSLHVPGALIFMNTTATYYQAPPLRSYVTLTFNIWWWVQLRGVHAQSCDNRTVVWCILMEVTYWTVHVKLQWKERRNMLCSNFYYSKLSCIIYTFSCAKLNNMCRRHW